MSKKKAKRLGPLAGDVLVRRANPADDAADEGSSAPSKVPIVRDMVDVDLRQMQECEHVWRSCVYVQRASQRLTQVTLAGSVDVLLGGLFPVPTFDRAVSDRILKNLERAMQWIDVVGMVPFSVDQVDMAVNASESGRGGEVGLRSDDPEANEKMATEGCAEDRPGSFTRLYQKRPHAGSGYTIVDDIGDGTDGKGDRPPAEFRAPIDAREPVDATDFDFTVPSLGSGRFSVYRDARDNIRKAVYHSPETDKHHDEHEPRLPERTWYVFTVDTPSATGKLSSIVSRLLPNYKSMQHVERLELEGARLGFQPQLVTEEHPPGKNQRQIDHHRAFTSDSDNMAAVSSKNHQGIDPFYSAALDKNNRFHRDLLRSFNIDYDSAVSSFVVRKDCDPENMQRIPKGNTLSSVLVPHKIIDTQAHLNTYIGRVAIEYGISHSDFASGTARFKIDQGTANARFIERARARRAMLSGFLYDVFKLKNGGRLREHLNATLNSYTEKAAVVTVARQKFEMLIEKSTRAALSHDPKGIPGEIIPPPVPAAPAKPSAAGAGKAPKPKPKPAPAPSSSANGSGASIARPTDPSPDAVTPLEVLPKPLQEMLRWQEQLKLSFEHLGEMRRVLADLVDSPQPLHVRWSQPLVADRDELMQAIEVLQYSEAKKNEIWRQYYAV